MQCLHIVTYVYLIVGIQKNASVFVPRREISPASRPWLPLSCAQSMPWRGALDLDRAHRNPLIWCGLIHLRWHEDCGRNGEPWKAQYPAGYRWWTGCSAPAEAVAAF